MLSDAPTQEVPSPRAKRKAHSMKMSSQADKRQADESVPQTAARSPIQSIESSNSTPNLLETPDESAHNLQSSPNSSGLSNTPHIFRIPQSPLSAPSDGHRTKAAKIAIPRLKKTTETASNSAITNGRHRVNHACEPCRQRKTKCSGERPVCTHCQDFKIACFYADGKRDRAKKQFGSMAEKVVDYEKLLKELSLRVGEEDATQIRVLLEQDVSAEVDDASPDLDSINSAEPEAVFEDDGAESDVSATVGSTGALDKTLEDFAANEKSRSTGFMGKNSEITWMQRLNQENKHGSSSTADLTQDAIQMVERGEHKSLDESEDNISVNQASYHLDDFAMPALDAVDAYELPTSDTANHLFEAYMTRIHPTFPIIGKSTFTTQFRRFMVGEMPGGKWLAILNVIFAISARYSHIIRADWRGDDRDHLVYFSRARILSLNGDTIFQHADLQQIQVTALMALYLLCTNQINRSWTILGIATRAACGLGLNMRNESPSTPDALKEIRYRVWWSLYVLEHHLGNMTGRQTSISDETCTTPLPAPFDEDQFRSENGTNILGMEMQKGGRNPSTCPLSSTATTTPSSDRSRSASGGKLASSRSPPSKQFPDLNWTKNVAPNSSLYFLEYVQLTRLTQQILGKLYTPLAAQNSWAHIQGTIAQLESDLNSWSRDLPQVFDFKRKLRDREFEEIRWNLGFFYYSTRMKINRPCLCRLDRKIPRQSAKSKEFNRDAAQRCVDAAQDMLSLIPDEPNAVGLNSVGPWWHIIHYIVQACTVIMLEMSFRATHMPEEAGNLIKSSKKAVRWLHQLSESSVSARRAWQFCDSMLRETMPKIGGNMDGMPTQPPDRGTVSFEDQAAGTLPPSMSASAYQAMTDFNAFTTFDQYLPYQQNVVGDMQGTQDQSWPSSTSAEFDLMNNAYREQGYYHMGNNFGHGNQPGQ